VNSSQRLAECRRRTTFDKKLSSIETALHNVLNHIHVKHKDIVTYQGRPYLDKMKFDRTEMLYWLQEERKVKALNYEAQQRHLPPLPATVTCLQPL
jgi:hypothetical protein